MDVQSLRNYIRQHLEVDDEELPDTILNIYLQEAFDRTMARDNRWPRYETTWALAKVIDRNDVTLPPDLNIPAIMSVISVPEGYRLAGINHENAEGMFPSRADTVATAGVPVYYSIWGNLLYLWPKVATGQSYDLVIRGYRQPVWTNSAGDIPDLDPRLHVTLCYFAMSLVYAAQEDEILEGVCMARWDRDLSQQMRAMLEPVHHRPLVLHGGSPIGGVPAYVVNLPPEGAP